MFKSRFKYKLKYTAVTTFFIFLLFHVCFAVAADQKLIEDITFEAPSGDEERIIFKLNGAHPPKIFAIEGEQPRVVFDFKDTTTAKIINNLINTNGKFIKSIRVGIHAGANPKTRVVLDLLADKEIDYKHNFDKKKNALIVSVHYAGTTPKNKTVVGQEENTKKIATALKAQASEAALPQPIEELKPTNVKTQPAPPEIIAPVKDEQTVEDTKAVEDIEAVEKALLPPEDKNKETVAADAEKTGTDTTKSDNPPVLSAVTFDNNSNRGEMVLFKLNNFHPPIVFGLEEGQPRVVCDFKETEAAKELPVSIKTDGKYVTNIRINKRTKPKKVRVVLDLAPNHSYDLQQVFFKDDSLFVIIINTVNNLPAQEKAKTSEEAEKKPVKKDAV